MPVPPYSSSTVMPSRPRSPILRHRSGGKLVVAVDLGRARRDLGGGELPHGLAQHVDRLAVVEVEGGKSSMSVSRNRHGPRINVRCDVYVNVKSAFRRRPGVAGLPRPAAPASARSASRPAPRRCPRAAAAASRAGRRASAGTWPSCGRSLPVARVDVEELADLRQREPEPLAAQDQLDPRALALAVDPRPARAARARAGPRPRRSGSRASSARIPARARRSSRWAARGRRSAAWRGAPGRSAADIGARPARNGE